MRPASVPRPKCVGISRGGLRRFRVQPTRSAGYVPSKLCHHGVADRAAYRGPLGGFIGPLGPYSCGCSLPHNVPRSTAIDGVIIGYCSVCEHA